MCTSFSSTYIYNTITDNTHRYLCLWYYHRRILLCFCHVTDICKSINQLTNQSTNQSLLSLLKCTEKKAAFLCSLLTILSQVAKTTEDHHTLVGAATAELCFVYWISPRYHKYSIIMFVLTLWIVVDHSYAPDVTVAHSVTTSFTLPLAHTYQTILFLCQPI